MTLIEAGLLGVAALLLARGRARTRTPRSLVMYQTHATGAAELRAVAEELARRLGTVPVPVRYPGDVLGVLRGARLVSCVLLHGHGSSRSVLLTAESGFSVGREGLPRYASPRTLARAMAPILADDFVVSLSACSAGSNPGESEWGPESYSSGGSRSFAAVLRDELVAAGAPLGEVRANTSPGTHGNPSGRTFLVGPAHVGRDGVSIMDEQWGPGAWRDSSMVSRWGSAVRGELGYRWITGERILVPRPDGVVA